MVVLKLLCQSTCYVSMSSTHQALIALYLASWCNFETNTAFCPFDQLWSLQIEIVPTNVYHPLTYFINHICRYWVEGLEQWLTLPESRLAAVQQLFREKIKQERHTWAESPLVSWPWPQARDCCTIWQQDYNKHTCTYYIWEIAGTLHLPWKVEVVTSTQPVWGHDIDPYDSCRQIFTFLHDARFGWNFGQMPRFQTNR